MIAPPLHEHLGMLFSGRVKKMTIRLRKKSNVLTAVNVLPTFSLMCRPCLGPHGLVSQRASRVWEGTTGDTYQGSAPQRGQVTEPRLS